MIRVNNSIYLSKYEKRALWKSALKNLNDIYFYIKWISLEKNMRITHFYLS